ncbi:NAD(P)-binding domain-containing protein [Nonomuraea soli]|uniref:Thioredoxin reductase n=1 Tax=Nonomuraea soli TaxID=1032476 RepID=A0A7W0CHV4_9ACTN|nr:NAD(P)-binding domain-containing protein [Nonomuraea soli]MBA2891406.1 thioredoxin reductase [Nonomuraea soli]
MNNVDVAVVGAGPYGLSVAAHAIEAGLDVRVYGRPMNAWDKHMPVGMLLKSEPFASHLADPARRFTLAAFCETYGFPYAYAQPTPVERFVDYGRWFADHNVGDRVSSTDVTSVERDGDLFLLTLATGDQVRSRCVVLAVGFLPFSRTPEPLRGLPGSLQAHSSQVHDLGEYAGQKVAVIGAGQSAIETASLLKEAGAHPYLVARTERLLWNSTPVADRGLLSRCLAPQSGLGTGWRSWTWSERPELVRHLPEKVRHHIVRTTLGPAGSWWLKDRFAGVETILGAQVMQAEAQEGVSLSLRRSSGEASRLQVDRVIAATGYAVDLRRMALLSPLLRNAVDHRLQLPVLSKDFETSVPGLFMVGLAAAATFGPVMRFVHGARFAAATVAPALLEHVTGARYPRVVPLQRAVRNGSSVR